MVGGRVSSIWRAARTTSSLVGRWCSACASTSETDPTPAVVAVEVVLAAGYEDAWGKLSCNASVFLSPILSAGLRYT
jgi:hypothetical protein